MREDGPTCAKHSCKMRVSQTDKDKYLVTCFHGEKAIVDSVICPCCHELLYLYLYSGDTFIKFCPNLICQLYNISICSYDKSQLELNWNNYGTTLVRVNIVRNNIINNFRVIINLPDGIGYMFKQIFYIKGYRITTETNTSWVKDTYDYKCRKEYLAWVKYY